MNYTLKERSLPFNSDYEVIVVGGGPAGVAAATSAAREGAKTLLVEASGVLGGMATIGLVPAWTPYSDGEKIIYGGLSKRAFLETRNAMPHLNENDVDWVAIDYERLKSVYDNMVSEVGVDVLYHTTLSGVEMADEKNVDALILANKAGLSAYKAKVYVDCTGDADLYAFTGKEYYKGDETGDVQPSTYCFIITNIDMKLYNELPRLYGGSSTSIIHKILKDKKYNIPDTHLCEKEIGPSTVGFNAGHIWKVDATDPQSVSKANIKGRAMARDFMDALREYHPAFKDAFLVSTASTIGRRESRRIIGDYTFTVEDFLARKSFEDEIARNNYFIDIHQNEDEQKKIAEIGHSDNRFEHYKTGESHGVPYRILCPRDLDNVLVAGRSVSTDRITQGSLRVMPCCLCEGEAAGMAAKYAADMDSVNIHKVDTQVLRKRLIEEDAYLPKLDSDSF